MPKGNRKKQQREKAVAEAVLQQEIKKSEEKIPDIVPNSALFKEDDGLVEKKKVKIPLHPRPNIEKRPAPPKTELVDLWGEEPVQKKYKPNKYENRVNQKPKKANLPTSDESYNSAKLITQPKKPQIEETETVTAVDPAEEVHDEEYHDGIGDYLEGDVPAVPDNLDKIIPPKPDPKPKHDLILNAYLPENMPVAEKMRIRKIIKENNRIARQRVEDALVPEFENTKQAAKEVEERNKEIASRPKKEKVSHLEKYIADEPLYEAEKVPESTAEITGDSKAFTRLQRSLEVRGVVPLHQ
ncbi:hypothetical protein TVAG_344050 [Trichomonas vaginalis G3]|uniref:Uncharacterized protein n=1 Tax=Trichomonas vaginalis (strain ATCC PRA-98 / G3) TaxID=412133 RepID=A2E7M6_TRIV3|nr:hypothetical protein TVAGG3_0598130 [Trichomonas vaginalis G3]EAY11311.1 hypothetical protein TVAG_344050 [Trichomonas vaginalis G3]KAI5523747.1 hypothetical protein TVAGG3_0598130 [Trichomonas vaginalis G3]|eukprot:XP_001323534.1 hypothetical protein [Trichomonas vaginalis G3]